MTEEKKEKKPLHESEAAELPPCASCRGAETDKGTCQGEIFENDLAVALHALEKVRSERDEYLEAARRLQADFENYKKRNVNIRTDAYEDGMAHALKNILPVLDNLERAVYNGSTQAEGGALLEGINLIYRQLAEALQKIGLEEIPALGEPFDHELHHAVMQGEAGEEHKPGRVCEVLQKGYCFKGRILRHSMVKVAQ